VKDVVVVAEHLEGKLVPTAAEAIARGRGLAAKLGGALHVAVAGHGVDALAHSLAAFGAAVIQVESPHLKEYTADAYAAGIKAACAGLAPRVVLLGHTSTGFDLAPRLAAELGGPVVGGCVDVDVDGPGLLLTRRILNDKVEVQMEAQSAAPIVVTFRPGSWKPAEPAPGGSVTRIEPAIDPATIRRRFLRHEAPAVQDIDIAQADVVVSAGRGIQKKENLKLVEEFAKLLGGVVGASRPLTDSEWLPKTRQVGQSGKSVRPKLYIACGISGAMQHVAGMKDSGLIVAINTDPTAPIFEVAHVGVVGDVLQVLPAVMKELRAG
jgi:electron transfer flavoprotein alpha subunit